MGMAAWYQSDGLSLRQAMDLPPVWLMGVLGLLWVLGQVSAPAPVAPLAFVGQIMVVAAIALMIWAIVGFSRHRTTAVPHQTPERLITSGAFAVSRNPIYLGDVMVLVGAVLWSGIWAGAMLIPVFVWILRRRFIAPEELRLKENFPDEFAHYAAKTRRWV